MANIKYGKRNQAEFMRLSEKKVQTGKCCLWMETWKTRCAKIKQGGEWKTVRKTFQKHKHDTAKINL